MKKKMQRVPDFSTKKPAQKPVPGADSKAKPPTPPTPPPAVKPQATSQKSGRRGA